MKISYKPLWKQLIDKDLKKKDLCELAGISPASVTKMGKCGHVTTETLERYASHWIAGWRIFWNCSPESRK